MSNYHSKYNWIDTDIWNFADLYRYWRYISNISKSVCNIDTAVDTKFLSETSVAADPYEEKIIFHFKEN